jgi:glycosyltransferase involved in cell wall biosynthesis
MRSDHQLDYNPNHICVCICTYKRPQFLRRLLNELGKQITGGLFTYSIVVVDNDYLRSAEAEVSGFAASSPIAVRYFVECEQNIALARNKAVENASGDYLAFIDDDEFPTETWLLTLFKACKHLNVDGVLGPVKPHFEKEPPKWIVKGKFWQRPIHPAGLVIDGSTGRTGNVILKAGIFAGNREPFRRQFTVGEDRDFFSRMVAQGRTFVYCDEAVAYETVPPDRVKRSFLLRRSLLQGCCSPRHQTFRTSELAKSVIAIPVFTAILPFVAIWGHHRFMTVLVKLVYHSGRILACLGVQVVRDQYVSD